MKDIKIAELKIDLKKSKNNRDELCAWLHTVAEEIKQIDDKDYIKNPKWNFII